jgi:hypothetical protein
MPAQQHRMYHTPSQGCPIDVRILSTVILAKGVVQQGAGGLCGLAHLNAIAGQGLLSGPIARADTESIWQ